MSGRADALVLFGATGDLARKKLLPVLYGLVRRGRLGVPVLGVFVAPLLVRPAPPHLYEPGSWGPAAAEALVAAHGRWHEPEPSGPAAAPA